ncbi:MAG TPA: YrdB family protein [Candidatus Saccharimonadia bacterium]|nr:YrdB family protein [Candidatus Saccharimonadia bacterium]
MKGLALLVAFLLEIVAFLSFSWLGSLFNFKGWSSLVLFFVLLALLTVFWSVFMAPKAPRRIKPPAYFIIKAVIYALAASVLWEKQNPAFAVGFVALSLIDEVIIFKKKYSIDD